MEVSTLPRGVVATKKRRVPPLAPNKRSRNDSRMPQAYVGPSASRRSYGTWARRAVEGRTGACGILEALGPFVKCKRGLPSFSSSRLHPDEGYKHFPSVARSLLPIYLLEDADIAGYGAQGCAAAGKRVTHDSVAVVSRKITHRPCLPAAFFYILGEVPSTS